MKIFFASYVLVGLGVSAALFFFNSQSSALAFLVGCLVMMLNVAGLYFAWSRILGKKQVALPLGVIVIKYAILGFIIYRIATQNLLELSWFTAGFTVVLISGVLSART